MFKHMLALAGLGAVLFSGPLALSLHADEWDKTTDITVNEPIDVDGTVLIPGEYVMKLMDSDSDRNIVQIYDQDQKHLITTVLATPAYRLEPADKPLFSFYETPADQAPALRTYFYPGDVDGLQFPERS
jgi:hypothetical protein